MATEAKRVTAHNGRASQQHGVYSPRHNDRNFDIKNADHIDAERTNDNYYWHVYDDYKMTFEQAESEFYNRHFQAALKAQNDKAIASRHAERVKTMDDYRHSRKTCPEETIIQIGCRDNTVAPDTLWNIVIDHMHWEQEQYPNVHILDLAMHVDEQGAPHVHERKVWISHDDEGREIVGQAKALKEMGIEAPQPDHKITQHNNPKMTYTRACREHLQQLCLDRGIELELTPREASRSGLELLDWQRRQEQERLELIRKEQEQLSQDAMLIRAKNDQKRTEMIQAEQNTAAAKMKLTSTQKSIDELTRKLEVEEERLHIYTQTEAGSTGDAERISDIRHNSKKYNLTGSKVILSKDDYLLLAQHAAHDTQADYTRSGIAEQIDKRMAEISRKATVTDERAQKARRMYAEATEAKAEAERKQQQAEDKLSDINQYIADEAQKLVDQAFAGDSLDRTERLEKFVAGYKVDGASLLEVFEQEEAALKAMVHKHLDLDIER